jgi:hypothetical protein
MDGDPNFHLPGENGKDDAWRPKFPPYLERTGRMTHRDTNPTYLKSTGRMTHRDTNPTYLKSTGRMTHRDTNPTYLKSTGRMTHGDPNFHLPGENWEGDLWRPKFPATWREEGG